MKITALRRKTVWTALAVLAVAFIQQTIPAPPPGAAIEVWSAAGVNVITRTAQGALVLGMLPVVPMTVVSSLLMIVVSRLTARSAPGPATMNRYFDGEVSHRADSR